MKFVQKFFFTTPILFWILIPVIVFARGGGGGSGGGGGGGGGGFGGSGSGSPSNLIFIAVVWGFMIIVLIVQHFQRKKKLKDVELQVGSAASRDSLWSEPSLKSWVTDTFFRFQKDWSNLDSEPMKEYCTAQFAEKMSLELDVLKAEHRINRVDDLTLKSVELWEMTDEEDNSKDRFTVEIHAQASDKLLEEGKTSPLMVESDPFTEYWTFVRDNNIWKLDTIRQATESASSFVSSVSDFAKKNNFFYDPDFGWLMIPNKGAIFSQTSFLNSDINNHVIGRFKNKIVEFYTYSRTQNNYGLNYLVAQTILPVYYNDILVRRRRKIFNFTPGGLRKIETESNDFNSKFVLFADPNDQINSFVLLAPDLMEEVYNLPFELNIEIVGNFLYFYVKNLSAANLDQMLALLSKSFDSMRTG